MTLSWFGLTDPPLGNPFEPCNLTPAFKAGSLSAGGSTCVHLPMSVKAESMAESEGHGVNIFTCNNWLC